MKFYIELIDPGFKPVKFNKYDAGSDVVCTKDTCIPYKSTKKIPLGFKIYIKPGWEMQIRDRSHIVLETPLRVADSPATIDAGFIEEVSCTISNIIEYKEVYKYNKFQYIDRFFEKGFQIYKGDRIAQVIFKEIPKIDFEIVNDINQYAKYQRNKINGEQGYGTTGM